MGEKERADGSRGYHSKKEKDRSRSRGSRSHHDRRPSRSRSKGRRHASSAPKEDRSSASGRRRSRSKSVSKDPVRRGKWDSQDKDAGFEPRPREAALVSAASAAPAVPFTPPAAPASTPATAPSRPGVRIQTFEEILEQVRTGGVPFQMPVMAGSALRGGMRLPAKPLHDMYRPMWSGRNDVVPVANEEVLRDAREKAKKIEDLGMDHFKRTGQVPKGPPAMPMGTMVIEQKFIDFIVGPGGQSLAALNYAAGVTVHLDQTCKYSGYTVAHIYGPEDCVRRAKLALEFKISQWLPRGTNYTVTVPTTTFSMGDPPATSSSPSASAVSPRTSAAASPPRGAEVPPEKPAGKPVTAGIL